MSSNYGVTPAGFVPKRMDTIYKEEHRDLSDAWGVNTMENPESLLNVILTGQADPACRAVGAGAGNLSQPVSIQRRRGKP